jgi:hypothetical protein
LQAFYQSDDHGGWGDRLMPTCSNQPAQAKALSLRSTPPRENRLALALIIVLSGATLSVMATTSALSRHHADQLTALTLR